MDTQQLAADVLRRGAKPVVLTRCGPSTTNNVCRCAALKSQEVLWRELWVVVGEHGRGV